MDQKKQLSDHIYVLEKKIPSVVMKAKLKVVKKQSK